MTDEPNITNRTNKSNRTSIFIIMDKTHRDTGANRTNRTKKTHGANQTNNLNICAKQIGLIVHVERTQNIEQLDQVERTNRVEGTIYIGTLGRVKQREQR